MFKTIYEASCKLKPAKLSVLVSFEVCTIFDVTPEVLRQRLKAKIQLEEFAAVAFAICSLIGLVFIQKGGNFYMYYDLHNFLSVGDNDFSHYYYAYWGIPFFSILSGLNFPFHIVLVGLLNILSVWFTARIFGNKILPLLVSVHMIYIFSQGQIAGILAGGFALFFAGLVWHRWHLAGLGMIIVLTKFQLGLIPVTALLLLWEIPWKQKLQVILVPCFVFLFSMVQYPNWPWQLALAIKNNPPYDAGSISLWNVIGPVSLVVWFPILLFSPRSKDKLFYLLVTCNILGIPYFQQTDLLLLLVLIKGYGAIFSNLPFIFTLLTSMMGVDPWVVIRTMTFIPLFIYFRLWFGEE